MLERGRVAERWRSERWDSLRLLTPNWMSRLPGWSYRGPDPHGFMTAAEVVVLPRGLRRALRRPPSRRTAPSSASTPTDDGFDVVTSRAALAGRQRRDRHRLVRPAGRAGRGPPARPTSPRSPRPRTATPARCPPAACWSSARRPRGVQLADELARAGRDVVLAVGSHSRLPRSYRGMDIFWWLERIGSLDRTIDELPDPRCAPSGAVAAARRPTGPPDRGPRHAAATPASSSPAGSPGWTATASASPPTSTDTLPRPTPACDGSSPRSTPTSTPPGLTAEVLDAEPPPASPSTSRADAARPARPRHHTVLWATGHRRTYRGCTSPCSTRPARSASAAACTPVPGLYVLGQRFQHYRNSNFIDGVGRDAATVADHLARRTASAVSSLSGWTTCATIHRIYDVVIVGARAAGAATAMLLARAGLRVLVVDRGRYGADTLSTHALMRGGVVQLHRWGLLDRIVDAGTPPIRRTTFRYATDESPSRSSRPTASTRSTRHGAPCSTRCSSTRPPRPAPTSATASRSPACGATGTAGSPASSAATAAGRRQRRRRRSSSAPTACARSSPATSPRRSSGAVPEPAQSSYGYWSDVDTSGYEWIFRPNACAG